MTALHARLEAIVPLAVQNQSHVQPEATVPCPECGRLYFALQAVIAQMKECQVTSPAQQAAHAKRAVCNRKTTRKIRRILCGLLWLRFSAASQA
jgi:deoxycytidylate deaminase